MLRSLQHHSAPVRSIRAALGRKVGRTESQFQLSAVYGARLLWREVSIPHVPENKRKFSLRSPTSTLDSSATSSPHDSYLRGLERAGMVNNPECPYDLISVDERLDMLRERERRWTNLDWAWSATLATPPITSDPTYAHGGTVYLNKEDAKENTVGLHSVCLPLKATDDVKWTEIDLGKTILISTLAIEEHDLIVCLTSCAQ